MVAALVAAAVAATVVGAGDRGAIVVTDPAGSVLARVPLGTADGFSLRYRNSLYGTLAQEHFGLSDGGAFELRKLEAEQLAVLEEYYAVDTAPQRAEAGWWTAPPAYELELDELRVAATDLGQRALLVPGQPPLDLWPLVEDRAPSVIITVEQGR
ncbi:hypothetical protein BH23CHL9_BH23CHL9_13380 [soil metagenome]